MSEIRFRASRCGDLMTGILGLSESQKSKLAAYQKRYDGEGKPLTKNQVIEFGKLLEKAKSNDISKTAKAFVEDTFIENEIGYREELYTDPILKGKDLEDDAIELVSEYEFVEYEKNEIRLNNDYVTGELDVNAGDHIKDIKIPKFKNFYKADLKNIYYTQGQCYMWLTGIKKYELTYVLMPDTDIVVERKLNYLLHKLPLEQYEEAEKLILNNNNIIKAMPIGNRIKTIKFDFEPEHIETLKLQIEKARIYYNSLFEKYDLV